MTKPSLLGPTFLLGLFLAVCVLMPLWHPLNIEFSEFNIKRIAEILLLAGSGLLLIASSRLRLGWLERFLQLPELARLGIVAFFALGVVSTLQAALPKYAFLEIGLMALLFFFTLSIAAEVTLQEKVSDRIVWLIFSAIGLYCIAFYANLFFPFGNNTLSPGFSNLRFLAQFQAWTLPLVTLPLYLKPELRGWRRSLILSVAALWWGITFFNSAKGLAVALLVSTVFIGLLMRERSTRSWFLLQLKLLAAGFALYLILTAVTSLEGYLTGIEGSVGSRLTLWQQSLEFIRQHPLLGIGPLHLANHYNAHAAHPHNSLLQLAAEWGVPATIIVLGLFIWGYGSWLKGCVGRQTPMDIALSLSLSTGAVYSLASGILVMPLSQVAMALVFGLALGRHHAQAMIRREIAPKTQWLLSAALVLILIRFTLVLFPEVLHLPRDEFFWIATHSQDGHAHLQPRFWQQGWFQRL
ncbi:MAG: O-antigen ligase family protein [Candidatus Thiodiazotropha sp.]